MKRLQFSFDTTVHYSAPVTGHQLALRCVPMTDAVQHLETCTVTIEPAPLPQPLRDGFGNTVYWYSALEPHTALRYAAVGVAAVDKSRADEAFPNPAFRCHGLRTKPGRTLLQVSSAMPKAGTYEAAEALCHAVHSLLQYTPGVTDTTTTAEAASVYARTMRRCLWHWHGLQGGLLGTAWGSAWGRGPPMRGRKSITRAIGTGLTPRGTALLMSGICGSASGGIPPIARWSRESSLAAQRKGKASVCG